MAKPNLRSLNALDFIKIGTIRQEKIDSAPAVPLPHPDTFKPNQLARALHPGTQYVKVTGITEHGGDARSFRLEPDAQKGTEALAWFSAGQYVSVSLEIGDMKLTRPYSLSSSPRESLEGFYTLTVKRVEGGLASQYILDNWRVGTCVTISEPLGTFTYEPLRDAKTIVGVAGGSGITPFRSLARAIADGDEDAELILLYGSRTLDDAIFRKELKELEAECSRFKLVNVLSHETVDGCEHGFITADLIRKYAPAGEYSIFLCGPQAMYQFVDKEIETLGLRKKFVRHELFGEYFNPSKETDYPGCERTEFELNVTMATEVYYLTASADESLLRTLEKNGIAAPARCRSGECGWCRSRLLAGNVYIPKNLDGRREADKDYCYIHPCCTFPLSDIAIEVPPVPEQ